MNYKRIYEQLVEKRKNQVFEGYGENHHIIPKCLGGTNDKDNLVRLTAREHFIAHTLLCKIYPQENKLWFAFNCMCNRWGSNQGKQKRTYKISSRIYDWCKRKSSELISEKMKGHVPKYKGTRGVLKMWNEEQRKQISERNKGAGNGMYGKKVSLKTSEAVAKANKERIWTPEMRFKGRLKGEQHPRYGKKWDADFGRRCAVKRCYNQLLRYNTDLIDEFLWDSYKINCKGKNISLKSIIKHFGCFKNMLDAVNQKYKTNFKLV